MFFAWAEAQGEACLWAMHARTSCVVVHLRSGLGRSWLLLPAACLVDFSHGHAPGIKYDSGILPQSYLVHDQTGRHAAPQRGSIL